MSDNVEHPSHYNAGGVETIEGIKAALGDGFSDYCLGNVLKYVWRCKHKGKLLEDLRKAAKYLEWAIEAAESNCPEMPDSSSGKALAIPEGWRELEENEPLSEDDLFDLDGEWVGHEYDPSGGVYSSRIHRRHIRKIETANVSDTPNSSIPDPGPGYRLLSKDPPEQVIRGDEYWHNFNSEWVESENFMHEGGPQSPELYYRRKIEPAEWIPKVGDRVRVVNKASVFAGKKGSILDVSEEGSFTIYFVSEDGKRFSWVRPEHLELIEAAS